MEIRDFRITLKAKEFDRTCQFYGGVLGLPRLKSNDDATGRSALYQSGTAQIEVRGTAREVGKDRAAKYHSPDAPMVITILVTSAENVYEELIFRDKNIPGGLRKNEDDQLVFETHDPDGVRIFFVEG